MATNSALPKPMPGPEVPVILPDGRMNPPWYEWLKQFYDVFKAVRLEIP